MASRNNKLLDLFRQLDSSDQMTLLAFAEFLVFRSAPARQTDQAVPETIAEPEAIPRPIEESVVAAVKRLSKTYPMINRNEILAETSDLLGQHVIQKRAAAAVIDELEMLFERHYREMRDAQGQD